MTAKNEEREKPTELDLFHDHNRTAYVSTFTVWELHNLYTYTLQTVVYQNPFSLPTHTIYAYARTRGSYVHNIYRDKKLNINNPCITASYCAWTEN